MTKDILFAVTGYINCFDEPEKGQASDEIYSRILELLPEDHFTKKTDLMLAFDKNDNSLGLCNFLVNLLFMHPNDKVSAKILVLFMKINNEDLQSFSDEQKRALSGIAGLLQPK